MTPPGFTATPATETPGARPEQEWTPDERTRAELREALSRFRTGLYRSLAGYGDALFELADALLCTPGPVASLVGLSEAPEHRRGYGGLFKALNKGKADVASFQACLAGQPIPRIDGRIVLAADVSAWPRPAAPTSPDRVYTPVAGGTRKKPRVAPGWPYSFVAALEPGATSWVALLDAARIGTGDDPTKVTAGQVRDLVERLKETGHWKPGDPPIMIVVDAGYAVTRLAHLLADLPVELCGRIRCNRKMCLPPPPKPPHTPGRTPRHGAEFKCDEPDTHPTPAVTTTTASSRYGTATAAAWDRLHPKLTHRGAWENHEGELPIVEGTVIRLTVDRLPGDRRDPDPMWLWCSRVGAGADHVDRLWRAYLRRFDIEHTFRFFKQVLGWTKPKIRESGAADLWTRLLLAAYTQLRLARDLVDDLRRPWERKAAKGRLSPARVRRGFRNLHPKIAQPAGAPKPSRPGPGRPAGKPNAKRAPHHAVGKKIKTDTAPETAEKQAG